MSDGVIQAGSRHPGGPVADAFERRIREREERELSPLATRSYPAQRMRPEADCGLRTPFQRDRDRIVHSKAFRRLKYKTQVFVSPTGSGPGSCTTSTRCGLSTRSSRTVSG